ncbi:mCG10610, isoform CRA_b, partial [Mus musculus]
VHLRVTLAVPPESASLSGAPDRPTRPCPPTGLARLPGSAQLLPASQRRVQPGGHQVAPKALHMPAPLPPIVPAPSTRAGDPSAEGDGPEGTLSDARSLGHHAKPRLERSRHLLCAPGAAIPTALTTPGLETKRMSHARGSASIINQRKLA